MFKWFLKSKEFNFFSVVSIVAALNIADLAPFMAWLPEAVTNISTPVIVFVVGLAGMVLRAFFTDGKLVWKKEDATE